MAKNHGPTGNAEGFYSRSEVMQLLGLRDEATLRQWSKRGVGPPFLRIGAKHARVWYPKAAFWEWAQEHTFVSEDEADGAME